MYRYVENVPLTHSDPSGETDIGSANGYTIVYHPSGAHPSGLDLHPAGNSLWVHAHVMKDGKVITRIGENGKPIPGAPELPAGAKKVVEEYKDKLRKTISKGRKQLALWKQQQALNRSNPGGNAGKAIKAISVLIVAAKFAEGAFAHGADDKIDKVTSAATHFAHANTFFNCCAYFTSMSDLFIALGMDSDYSTALAHMNIRNICSKFPAGE